MPLAQRIGARIKRLRLERGFTFDAFVESCGLSRGFVGEIEAGKTVASLLSLEKIAIALELSLCDLIAVGDSLSEQMIDLVVGLPPHAAVAVLECARHHRSTANR